MAHGGPCDGSDAVAGLSWRPTPGLVFPAAWPPAGGAVVFLPYAIAIRASLHDGAHTAAPWAHVDVSLSDAGPPRVKVTTEALRDLGVQGVSPSEAGEWERIGAAQDALIRASSASGLPDAATAQTIRDGYCLWLGRNGVVAGPLRAAHRAFFDWLECD